MATTANDQATEKSPRRATKHAPETPTPTTFVRRRDSHTGVVIRVADTHPYATDSGWVTIDEEKDA